MSNYLQQKYVGKYRVLIEYDQIIGDFIRDEEGRLEKSFDDFYIPCGKGGKISHIGKGILEYYIDNKRIGRNILQDIKSTNKELYSQITDVEETDSELRFSFKSTLIDDLSAYLNPKTRGKNISPYSTKNLPMIKDYKIPKEDVDEYKKVVETHYKNADGKIQWGVVGFATNEFIETVKKIDGKKVDIKKEKRASRLKGNEFIHSVGLWEKYLKFLIKKGGA